MTEIAVREPTSLVEVDSQCASIEVWAQGCISIPELRDAANRLAAIDEYVSRTSASGRSRVAAAMRRIEIRMGALIGQAEMGRNQHSNGGLCRDTTLLNDTQRKEFRRMAEHPEVVEEVIAESTDEKPASRRTVMERLREAAKNNPVEPLPFQSQAAVKARVAKAREMAEQSYTSSQIAAEIGITIETFSNFKARWDIKVPADAVIGKARRHDTNRIMTETVTTLEAVVMGVDLIEISALDPAQLEHWVVSLTSSTRSLNRFLKQIKETTTQ